MTVTPDVAGGKNQVNQVKNGHYTLLTGVDPGRSRAWPRDDGSGNWSNWLGMP